MRGEWKICGDIFINCAVVKNEKHSPQSCPLAVPSSHGRFACIFPLLSCSGVKNSERRRSYLIVLQFREKILNFDVARNLSIFFANKQNSPITVVILLSASRATGWWHSKVVYGCWRWLYWRSRRQRGVLHSAAVVKLTADAAILISHGQKSKFSNHSTLWLCIREGPTIVDMRGNQ